MFDPLTRHDLTALNNNELRPVKTQKNKVDPKNPKNHYFIDIQTHSIFLQS
jgi:hypothetical protein